MNFLRRKRSLLPSCLAMLCAYFVGAAEPPRPASVRDLPYAKVGEVTLGLDLYLPEGRPRPPLIVWVHGGAWRSGAKKDMPLGRLVAEGYAVASVDYRLSTQAKFPAQIHDLKAATGIYR